MLSKYFFELVNELIQSDNLYYLMVAQRLKHLPGMLETRVRSLGWEDPLEKETATTPILLPGEPHKQYKKEK